MAYFSYVARVTILRKVQFLIFQILLTGPGLLVCRIFVLAARFVVVSDQDVIAFSKQQETENTKKKTLCDLNIFK